MSTENPNFSEDTKEQKSLENSSHEVEETSSGIGLLQTVISIFAAVFGIQSEDKHKRDFEKGDASNFILGGIIFVILLIITIYIIVGIVLENAGVS